MWKSRRSYTEGIGPFEANVRIERMFGRVGTDRLRIHMQLILELGILFSTNIISSVCSYNGLKVNEESIQLPIRITRLLPYLYISISD